MGWHSNGGIMTLQNSGTSISFSQIENEFGQNSDRDLGEYRVSQTVGRMSNLPLDSGIPQSGQIRFSDFYGKELNVVIHYSSNANRPNDGYTKFSNNSGKVIIGGFKSANSVSESGGKRVTLHVGTTSGGITIGSERGTSTDDNARYICALRTGTGWQSNTELDIVIGSGSIVTGGGGDGGRASETPGSGDSNPGDPGKNGNSAIGVQYPVENLIVQSGAIIRAGCGGGGGGGSGKEDSETEHRRASGGGGGGGAGTPAGLAGGSFQHEEETSKSNAGGQGNNGNSIDGGKGGNGAEQGGEAFGGGGGGGGSFEVATVNGEAGNGGAAGVKDGGSGAHHQAMPGQNGNLDGGGGNGGEGGKEESNGEFSSGGEGGSRGFAVVRYDNVSVNNNYIQIQSNGTALGLDGSNPPDKTISSSVSL